MLYPNHRDEIALAVLIELVKMKGGAHPNSHILDKDGLDTGIEVVVGLVDAAYKYADEMYKRGREVCSNG